MPIFRDRFRDLDTLDVPDLLEEAERRGPQTPMSLGPSPGKRAGTVLVAILIAAVPYALFAARDRSAPDVATSPAVPSEDCSWDETPYDLPDLGANARVVAGTSLDDLWVLEQGSDVASLLRFDGEVWETVLLPDGGSLGHGGGRSK